MLWLLLACVLLGVVFLRSLVMPMLIGFAIGTGVYFASPMLQLEPDTMLIMFGGIAGLTLGLIRSVIWIPKPPKKG